MDEMNFFDDSATRRRLNVLPRIRQLAFALLLCERLMLALRRFGHETGFETHQYRTCLEMAWEYLLNGSREPERYESASRRCLEGAPDTEDFTHPLTSDALNAALSVSELMCFLVDHDIDHIMEAIRFARESAAMHVQAVAPTQSVPVSLNDMLKHELMQQEVRREEDELSFAESLSDDPAEVVKLTKDRISSTTACS